MIGLGPGSVSEATPPTSKNTTPIRIASKALLTPADRTKRRCRQLTPHPDAWPWLCGGATAAGVRTPSGLGAGCIRRRKQCALSRPVLLPPANRWAGAGGFDKNARWRPASGIYLSRALAIWHAPASHPENPNIHACFRLARTRRLTDAASTTTAPEA